MIVWVAVIITLSLIAFIWIKLEHQARLIKFAILTLMLVMLAASLLVLFRSGEVDLSSPQGIINAVYLYIGWLGDFATEMWDIGIETTGNVVDAMNVSESELVK